MSALAATGSGDDLASLRERKRMFDDVWLLTLFVVFLAIAVPWFMRILDVELGPLAWSLFGFGVVYLLAATITDQVADRRRLLLLISALQGIGIVFLGYVWHLAGGLQNPTFLLVFGLPVVAGGLVLQNWQAYVCAALGIASVVVFALLEAPELRWYLLELGLPLDAVLKYMPHGQPAVQPSVSAIAPASYVLVLLELFAAFLIALALMVESLNAFLRRLYRRLAALRSAAEEAEDAAREALRASPLPALWVVPGSFEIERASDSFLAHFALPPDAPVDASLFDRVHFSYPDVVERLIDGGGGEYRNAIYRIGPETRVANIRALPVRQGGSRYAHVTFEDLSELYLMRAAFDATDDALLVIDPAGTIAHCNPGAARMFPAACTGEAASVALDRAEFPQGWWKLGLRGRMVTQVELAGERFRVHCVALDLPGESEKFTAVTLRTQERR